MDTDQITQLASSETEVPEARGAGGKVRKPPLRKLPATPYACPPETGSRRWITKLVDPAYRLIAGGATLILPSFFSASSSALTGPSSANEDQGKLQAGEQGCCDDGKGQPDGGHKSDLHLRGSRSTELTGTSDTSGKLKSCSDFILHRQDENVGQSEENGLSDIERLVKRNKFSRDDFNRLVELLNSRAMGLPKQREERKDDEGFAIAHRLPKVSNDCRHEELKGAIWGSSTPPGQSNVRDEIGASPIEIARAYMDSRATEVGPSSKSVIQNVGSSVLHGDEAAITSYDSSPSMKTPSTCWPGVVVQDTYITPQGQRNRSGLYKFLRTPYSRTLLSKSKSRSTRIEGEYANILSTPLHQSQTVYLQDKSKVDASKSGYGSVGPIRRISRKVGSQSSSRLAYSSLNGPSQRKSSVVNEGFTPTVTKGLDPDGTNAHKVGFEAGIPVHMHTSLMAKKILEHIDRNIPTPKEKSAELNLATKWKSPESSVNVSTILSNENNGLLKLGVSPYKYDGLAVTKCTPRNDGQGNYHIDILPRESTDRSTDVRKEGTLASDMNVWSSIPTLGNDARSMKNYAGSENFLMKSTEEDALKTLPSGGHPSIVNEEKKPLSNSSASKPVLTPISIKKPDSRWTLASDNGSGFTFPISTSSSVFSEPPTPSIMPLFSGGDKNQSNERSTGLSYSFGLKRSNATVIFSFPSTSKPAAHNDASDIKFNFSSNEKVRLHFSFGKNAVCC